MCVNSALFRITGRRSAAALIVRGAVGVGAGERLNEHVVGWGWPAVETRRGMSRESLEIVRLL